MLCNKRLLELSVLAPEIWIFSFTDNTPLTVHTKLDLNLSLKNIGLIFNVLIGQIKLHSFAFRHGHLEVEIQGHRLRKFMFNYTPKFLPTLNKLMYSYSENSLGKIYFLCIIMLLLLDFFICKVMKNNPILFSYAFP